MAQPPAYNRVKDFGADHGDETDNQAINTELDAVGSSVNGIRNNLAKIQRDDGGLCDGIVTADSLAPSLKSDLYSEFSGNINDSVLQAQQAAVEATNAAAAANADAATAVSARNDAQTAAGSAQASAAAASASQAAASASATSAASSAAAASTSATGAAGSASAAAGSASTASTAASNAGASATAASASATSANQAKLDAQTAAGTATAAATAASASEVAAEQYALQAQAYAGLSLYPANAIPTSPVLGGQDIYVNTLGRYRWSGSRYVPNNFQAGHRSGGLLTHATTTVTVGSGEWRDSANSLDILLAGALTKTIQASGGWAAGNNQNGLFSGAKTNSTWYEAFVIVNGTTGAVDIGFDTNATAANRPSGWTAYQLIGSVYVDGTGSIRPFVNPALREFLWVQRTQDVNGGGASDAAGGTAVTLAVPIRRRVIATIGTWLDASNPTAVVAVSPVDAIPATVGTAGALGDIFRATNPTSHFNTLQVLTSTAGQIIAKATSGVPVTAALGIGTRGWREIF